MLKTQIFEKSIFLQWKKGIGQSFFVLSDLTNLKEQLLKVHKVVWQKLNSLQDHF